MRILAAAMLCAFPMACTDPQSDATKQVAIDTIGTVAFDVRRTIGGRTVFSPEPISVARDALFAQSDLCPRGFTVMRFDLSDVPPALTYSARVRCR